MNNAARIAAQAMNALSLRHDIISSNLANVNTSGYKSDVATMRSFQSVFNEKLGLTGGGVAVDSTSVRFDQGTLVNTGNKFDFAIEGEGFFVIQTPQGQMLTRNGGFVLNQNGELSTKDGSIVLGESGPITVNGTDVDVSDDGEIFVDQSSVGKVRVVSVTDTASLEKAGYGMFKYDPAVTQLQKKPADTKVASGFTESSSVNAVGQMIDMIENMRLFEANQKIIISVNDIMNKAISLGKV